MSRVNVCLRFVVGFAALVAASLGAAQDAKEIADPEVAESRADFRLQGEYSGEIDGEKIGLQVVARLGKESGKFEGIGYTGGLPGDGWSGGDRITGSGDVDDAGVLTLRGDDADRGSAKIADGVAKIYSKDGEFVGMLKRVHRESPTLGKKAPKGAIVLFDGTSADAFDPGKMSEDGLLIPRADTKQKLGSGALHVEFRTPYSPGEGDQGRGNSGVYLQSRYEVQVLDSFGVVNPGQGDCGSIYSIRTTSLNMCFPPLSWQTYDIEFTASSKAADGSIADGRITVRHNGVLIHENVQLTKSTTAAPITNKDPTDAQLHLQWHGNPVRFRNIWFVPAAK